MRLKRFPFNLSYSFTTNCYQIPHFVHWMALKCYFDSDEETNSQPFNRFCTFQFIVVRNNYSTVMITDSLLTSTDEVCQENSGSEPTRTWDNYAMLNGGYVYIPLWSLYITTMAILLFKGLLILFHWSGSH